MLMAGIDGLRIVCREARQLVTPRVNMNFEDNQSCSSNQMGILEGLQNLFGWWVCPVRVEYTDGDYCTLESIMTIGMGVGSCAIGSAVCGD